MFISSRPFFILTAACLSVFSADRALAGSSNGSNALALGALIGECDNALSGKDRKLLRAWLNGNAGAPHAKGKVVSVKADSVDCRASNVDITTHECDLTFGGKKRALHGRGAHELYATLLENGVAPDGAAGSVHAAVTALDCELTADDIADRAGGGAKCSFTP